LSKVFGVELDTEDLDEQFLDLLNSWLEGSEEAGVEIQKILGK
jgi:hypothetical protein